MTRLAGSARACARFSFVVRVESGYITHYVHARCKCRAAMNDRVLCRAGRVEQAGVLRAPSSPSAGPSGAPGEGTHCQAQVHTLSSAGVAARCACCGQTRDVSGSSSRYRFLITLQVPHHHPAAAAVATSLMPVASQPLRWSYLRMLLLQVRRSHCPPAKCICLRCLPPGLCHIQSCECAVYCMCSWPGSASG